MSKTFAHRLSEGWPPLQSIPGPACRRPLGRGASLEFLPLQRMQMREPTHPGFASSRFGCGCRVSHPLAAFRLPRPSGRLGPVTLMGFPPSKRFPPGGAATPLGARCPLVVTRTRRTQPKTTCSRLASPTSGPCSPPESVAITRGLVVRPLDAPLGFCRSRAFLVSVAARLPGGSPLRLWLRRLAPRRPGLPGSRSALAVLRSSFRRLVGAATLLRFCTSFPFRVLRAAASRACAERSR